MAEADPKIAESEASSSTAATPAPRRWGRIAAMISLPLVLLIGGYLYWQGLQG